MAVRLGDLGQEVVDVNYGNEPDGPRADARAVVVVCSGLPGTGKSRLAEGIARDLGISVFSVAWVLGALAPFGFLERPDRGEIAYALLTALVEHQLRLGQSAVVDGMVGSRHVRRRLRELADLNGADFRAIECVCSDAKVHRERIEARTDRIPGWPDPGWDHVMDVRRRYAPWTGERLIVDSIRPFDENLVTAENFVQETLAPEGFRAIPRDPIRDWYAMLAAGDIAGALAAFDPDVEWIEAESSPYGGRGPIRGREAILRTVWEPLQRDWEHLTIEPGEFIELPMGVLALVRYRGVRRGSGARLDAQAAHLWDLEGDRIVRYRGFADTHALQLATG